jgi:hypothetical protein
MQAEDCFLFRDVARERSRVWTGNQRFGEAATSVMVRDVIDAELVLR